jgi:hypothetical protein
MDRGPATNPAGSTSVVADQAERTFSQVILRNSVEQHAGAVMRSPHPESD